MPNNKTCDIVIIAGEASGDHHAAAFVNRLKNIQPNMTFTGIGGQAMQTAGVNLLSDLARYGVTGIVEVLRHVVVIRQAWNLIRDYLIASPPRLLVLVDYPGFNLRLAQFAKRHGIPVLYYISPQIWAWKAKRIHTIRQNVDHMAVIFPFEKKLYQNAAVPVSFVGHPLLETLPKIASDPLQQRQRFNLPQHKRLIALLPGSRLNEIAHHMPIFVQTALLLQQQLAQIHFVIPVAPTIPVDLIAAYFKNTTLSHTLIHGHALDVVNCSDCVVVASGTASLECALLEKPMCIVYKLNALTALAAAKLVRVRYAGLCNILQNAMIVPELLQYDFNPQELMQVVISLLNDEATIQSMKIRLQQLRNSLSSQSADCTIEELILQMTQEKNVTHDAQSM